MVTPTLQSKSMRNRSAMQLPIHYWTVDTCLTVPCRDLHAPLPAAHGAAHRLQLCSGELQAITHSLWCRITHVRYTRTHSCYTADQLPAPQRYREFTEAGSSSNAKQMNRRPPKSRSVQFCSKLYPTLVMVCVAALQAVFAILIDDELMAFQ